VKKKAGCNAADPAKPGICGVMNNRHKISIPLVTTTAWRLRWKLPPTLKRKPSFEHNNPLQISMIYCGFR
jgi:hypothetical protein